MYNPRYVVEALDRTLGGDWFQVGEAAPGDRKVGNIKIYFVFQQMFDAEKDRATGAQAQVQVQGESRQQDREVGAVRDVGR